MSIWNFMNFFLWFRFIKEIVLLGYLKISTDYFWNRIIPGLRYYIQWNTCFFKYIGLFPGFFRKSLREFSFFRSHTEQLHFQNSPMPITALNTGGNVTAVSNEQNKTFKNNKALFLLSVSVRVCPRLIFFKFLVSFV